MAARKVLFIGGTGRLSWSCVERARTKLIQIPARLGHTDDWNIQVSTFQHAL